ncbi:hypothetical protein B0H17DRAFT_1131985 [Mycena rosella]|uniref:Uncharacterized protein n=1 Tax=Mycena rosella TaxID=1033263 RepID=A0AAD7DPB4_MYCRO|nr:hypothetical protein B0H17DRAFT_1131985 [Mycena rosella]
MSNVSILSVASFPGKPLKYAVDTRICAVLDVTSVQPTDVKTIPGLPPEGAADTILGLPLEGAADLECLQTDIAGTALLSQSPPEAGGLKIVCSCAGGEDCTYLSGTRIGVAGSCPVALISDGVGAAHLSFLSSPYNHTYLPSLGDILRSQPDKPPGSSSTGINTGERPPASTSLDAITTSFSITGSTAVSASPASNTTTAGKLSQPSVGDARKPLSAGPIVDIAFGTLTFLVVLIVLIFSHRRRYPRIRRLIKPVFDPEITTGNTPVLPAPAAETGTRGETGMSGFIRRSASTRSPTKIIAAQRDLDALNDAVSLPSPGHGAGLPCGSDEDSEERERPCEEESDLEEVRRQIQAQEERIGMLENQLQSQWALGLSEDPPPGYLE